MFALLVWGVSVRTTPINVIGPFKSKEEIESILLKKGYKPRMSTASIDEYDFSTVDDSSWWIKKPREGYAEEEKIVKIQELVKDSNEIPL